MRVLEDAIAILNSNYNQLLIDIEQSVGDINTISEKLGSPTVGSSDMNMDLLDTFEKYVTVRGMKIGRWKIYEGNGHHLFIIDNKRKGYYRFDKTCMQKQVIGMPSREPINSRYANDIGSNSRTIY